MWKIYILLAIAMAVVSLPAHSDKLALSTCEYIAADDKKRLRSLLKQNRMKIKTLHKMVFCNNQTILLFADTRQAKDVGELIIKKLPKKVVAEALPSLTSEQLIAAANNRIN
ncbi:DUF3718 domain-containing protein [Thalassotalea euphylliae]|uniref:DUF3718 domain-containing protein n=1 Tax=Thalassotalea euphylliae TaxID=1655234 RepID=UPI003626A10A